MTTPVPKVGSARPGWYPRWVEGPPTKPGLAAAPGKGSVLTNSSSDHFLSVDARPVSSAQRASREGPAYRRDVGQHLTRCPMLMTSVSHPPTKRHTKEPRRKRRVPSPQFQALDPSEPVLHPNLRERAPYGGSGPSRDATTGDCLAMPPLSLEVQGRAAFTRAHTERWIRGAPRHPLLTPEQTFGGSAIPCPLEGWVHVSVPAPAALSWNLNSN